MINIEIAWINENNVAQTTKLNTPNTKILTILQTWRPTINWQQEFAEKNLAIWNNKINIDYICKNQERIEWLKPLLCDPKVARKNRISKP